MKKLSLTNAIAVLLGLNFQALALVWLGLQAFHYFSVRLPEYEHPIKVAVILVSLVLCVCLWWLTISRLFSQNSKIEMGDDS